MWRSVRQVSRFRAAPAGSVVFSPTQHRLRPLRSRPRGSCGASLLQCGEAGLDGAELGKKGAARRCHMLIEVVHDGS